MERSQKLDEQITQDSSSKLLVEETLSKLLKRSLLKIMNLPTKVAVTSSDASGVFFVKRNQLKYPVTIVFYALKKIIRSKLVRTLHAVAAVLILLPFILRRLRHPEKL